MLKVEKWLQGKTPIIAYFAISHALTAREQCEALRHIKERRVYGHQFPLPDLPSWFSMYRSQKPHNAFKRFIAHISEHADKTLQLMYSLQKQESEKSLAQMPELCANQIEDIKDEIAETKLNPYQQDRFNNTILTDELPLGFHFLVYAPCFLLYEMTPAVLYRKALKRDISSIEKLLMLDPLILHDPAIGYQIQHIRLNGKTNDYERIINAILKQPDINYSELADKRKSIKSDLGSYVYFLAKTLNFPLKASQIRDLYDALAFDFEGTLNDTDIQSPEGFDKTIKTKAQAWQEKFQKPEKEK